MTTLLGADNRAYLTIGTSGRYALGDPANPALTLNAADAFGCFWLADVPDGWEAPEIVVPMDRRSAGHGGYAGEPTFDPRTITVAGAVTAPSPEALAAAAQRFRNATLGPLPSMWRYTHLDEYGGARGLWVYPSGKPLWRALDDRVAEFSIVLVAEDPIKTGSAVSYGPVRLPSAGGEGGYPMPLTAPSTSGGQPTLTETRRNLAPNPDGTNLAAWGVAAGTGGVASAVAAGQVGGTPATYINFTWTTAATAGGAGIGPFYGSASSSGFAIPVTVGTTYSGSIMVRSSRAQTVQPSIQWYGADGTTLVGAATLGAVSTLVAGAWTTLTVSGAVAPAGAVYGRVRGYTTAAGVAPQVGDTWGVTQALLEAAPVPGVYFDGNTADTSTLNYAWAGAARSSASIEQTATPNPASASLRTVALVANAGDEDSHAVYAVTGPVPHPTIALGTGEFVQLLADLSATDTWTVDTAAGSFTVNGVNRYDAWGPGSTFPLIPPGGTELRLRSAAGGSDPAAGLTATTTSSWK